MKLTGAQIIIRLLEKQGITRVAGIPGGSILPLYDELAKSSVTHILVRHEQAAGFIAQGEARVTGFAAVCFATSGPGAMNLLTAIADARCDSVPMVIITGQVNTALIGTDAFQEADTFGLSFPITKHSMMVKKAADLVTAIPKAFAIAMTGRPGPVLVDVPRDVQTEVCDVDLDAACVDLYRRPVRFSTPRENYDALIAQFVKILSAAKKPVLYAGGGCASPETAELLRQFLSIYPAPVVTSLMGLTSVSHEYAGFAGMVGMHGSSVANKAMYESDVVLALGARFDDRAVGLAKGFCPHARILQVEIDAAEVNKIYPAQAAVVGDVQDVLPLLTDALRAATDEIDASVEKACRTAWFDSIGTLFKKIHTTRLGAVPSDVAVNPREFIRQLPELAEKAGCSAKDIIVTTDVGQHQMWVAQYYPFTAPRTLLTSGSLGTMGFGLPAAIGAALACPDKRIVCFSGDGSILMNVQELATLAELNLPVTVIVFQNGTLGMVRQQQKYLYDRTYSASEFIKVPDFVAVAKGFGIRAVDADKNEAWYDYAFGVHDIKPCLVLVRVDPEEDVLPYVKAGQKNIDALQ